MGILFAARLQLSGDVRRAVVRVGNAAVDELVRPREADAQVDHVLRLEETRRDLPADAQLAVLHSGDDDAGVIHKPGRAVLAGGVAGNGIIAEGHSRIADKAIFVRLGGEAHDFAVLVRTAEQEALPRLNGAAVRVLDVEPDDVLRGVQLRGGVGGNIVAEIVIGGEERVANGVGAIVLDEIDIGLLAALHLDALRERADVGRAGALGAEGDRENVADALAEGAAVGDGALFHMEHAVLHGFGRVAGAEAGVFHAHELEALLIEDHVQPDTVEIINAGQLERVGIGDGVPHSHIAPSAGFGINRQRVAVRSPDLRAEHGEEHDCAQQQREQTFHR